jgi:hypothetical protein
MFAKIENNQVAEWPILSIYQRFPHTSFPSPLTDDALPEGYVMVGVIAPPEHSENQKVVPGQPVQQSGKWVQSWDVVDMTEAEIEERISVKAADIRAERNRKLAESDWTQLLDAPVAKDAWAAYRQALRDITQQVGFPTSVEWSISPGAANG